MDHTHFYLQQLTTKFDSSASLALRRVQSSKTILELVRSINSMPVAQAIVRSMPEVRQKQSDLRRISEAKAEELITEAISTLDDMTPGSDEFETAKFKIAMDVRYLSGHTPLALQKGMRQIMSMEAASTAPEPRARPRG